MFNILLLAKLTHPASRSKLPGGVLYSPVPAIYNDLLISSFIFPAVASRVAAIFKDSYQGINRIAQRKTWGQYVPYPILGHHQLSVSPKA
jgi:hypothetical protein